MINLEIREKFTRWKKPESFKITRAKISAVREIGDAALIRVRSLLKFLSQMRRLFEGGAYSSKYGNWRANSLTRRIVYGDLSGTIVRFTNEDFDEISFSS